MAWFKTELFSFLKNFCSKLPRVEPTNGAEAVALRLLLKLQLLSN